MSIDRLRNLMDEFANINTGDDFPTLDEQEDEDMADLREEFLQIRTLGPGFVTEEFR